MRVSRVFAVLIPCFTIPMQVVDLLPGQFSFGSTLPLQLCDFAWIAATVALWTHHRYVVALTYYWGLVLTTQALVTPWLTADFPSPKFLGFWGMHYLIVWAAIYLVWGLGLSPRWRDYATTVATTAAWAVGVYASTWPPAPTTASSTRSPRPARCSTTSARGRRTSSRRSSSSRPSGR